MRRIAKGLAGWIAKPIWQELPFFCLMVFAMFFSHFLWWASDGIVEKSVMHWRNLFIALSLSVFMAWGLAAIISLWRSRFFKILLYAIAAWLMLTDLFLFFNFGSLLSPWVLLLMKETNSTESSEFLNRYLLTEGSFISYGCLLLFCLTAFLWEKRWKGRPYGLWLESTVALVAMPFLMLGAYLFFLSMKLLTLQSQYDFEAWHERQGLYAKQSTPTNLLYSALFLRVSGKDNEQAIRVCQEASHQPAVCTEQDTLNVVLVIGESFSKWHSPLYGYYLNTTPRLRALRDSGNLFVFQDVIAPYNLTTFSVKNILSTNSLADSEPWYACPAFPIIFKKAGFHVSVWDNQRPEGTDVSTYDYALGSYLYAPQMLPIAYCEYNTMTFKYDLDLMQACKQRRERQQAKGRRHKLCLYVFHLMGQHSDAAWRFPHTEALQVFKSQDIRRDDLDESARQTVADYDNATHYNDLVVSSIVDMFKGQPSVMLYLSDHGEEVYDYRPFIGRSHEQKKSKDALRCQYGIPFLVWCSDRYMKTHPQQMEAIRGAVDRPATADDVAHTLFSLAGIQTPYYQSRRDVLSSDYVVGQRIVQGYIDYDND